MAETFGFDAKRRRVLLDHGEIGYDSLIVATGSHHYFGNEQWRQIAPGLKTVEDATEIRSRIFSAFEAAEREYDAAQRQAFLTFAIVALAESFAE